MLKFDYITGTSEASYIGKLSELLDNAYELVEVAENKTSALWIFHNILRGLAGTVNYYRNTIKKCQEVADNPLSTESQLTFWYDRKVAVDGFERGIAELYEEFGKRYDKQVIDYTTDNLDNFRAELPSSEDILNNNTKPKKEAETARKEQLRQALKFNA